MIRTHITINIIITEYSLGEIMKKLHLMFRYSSRIHQYHSYFYRTVSAHID